MAKGNKGDPGELWSESADSGLELDGSLLSTLDPELLLCVLTWRMPFGRHETWPLLDLPEPYVVWMYRNAGLDGKLGRVWALLYEIKVNGLERVLEGISREEIESLRRRVEG